MSRIAKNVTLQVDVKVTMRRWFDIRLALACWMIRLAAKVAGMGLSIAQSDDTAGPPYGSAHMRDGVASAPFHDTVVAAAADVSKAIIRPIESVE